MRIPKLITNVVLLPTLLTGLACTDLQATTLNNAPINVSAEVQSSVTLQLTVVDQQTGAEVSSLDFGELNRVGNQFLATKVFKVEARILTSGRPYELVQTSTPLARVGGSEVIPPTAFVSKPFYDASYNAGAALSPGARLGSSAPVGGSQRVLADPTGTAQSVHILYSLSTDPTAPAIPLNQKSGAYTGTVQYTLTTG